MFGLGPLEIVVIAAIAVMMYGKRLPEVGQTVGKTVGQLRKQWQAMSREFEMAATLDAQPATRRPVSARRLDDEGGPTVASPKLMPPQADEA
ncbi:MAG: twin-arginine translocase TatA/TatE family subunit [Planctomycetota bacterium]